MSQLPVTQDKVSSIDLLERVKNDMADFGEDMSNNDFEQALLALRDSQALVFFGDRENISIVATQHGFHLYGTD